MYKNRRNRPPHACSNIQWDHGWSFVSDPFYQTLCFQTSTGISLKYHQCLHFYSHLRKNIPKSYNTMHKELSPHLSHILRLCPLVLVSPPGKKAFQHSTLSKSYVSLLILLNCCEQRPSLLKLSSKGNIVIPGINPVNWLIPALIPRQVYIPSISLYHGESHEKCSCLLIWSRPNYQCTLK